MHSSVAPSSPRDGSRIAELEALVATQQAQLVTLQQERDRAIRERDQLRESHQRLRLELEMLKRRIFVAKAERVNTAQLELEFAAKAAELEQLTQALAEGSAMESPDDPPEAEPAESSSAPAQGRRKPTGRRRLQDLDLPEERIEVSDPLFEELVAAGKAERIGTEDSYSLGYVCGGKRRIITARVKYRVVDGKGEATIETAPLPPRTFRRSLLAPSMIARLIVEKYCDGLPFYRVEQRLEREGLPIDRGTLSRIAEDAGATLGATVVEALTAEARSDAFCIATDATGVLIQPLPNEKGRQPCRRGHFFVMVADQDHVIFQYTPKHTSDFVKTMLHGFTGYVQADANSVYAALFRPPQPRDSEEERARPRPSEVGCWSHCRRGFWETATTTKDPVAREGLLRIGKLFELDASWKKKPPDQIQRLRQALLRPHMEAFFAWAEAQYELVRERRGPLRSALGYAVRQRAPLERVLEDGRLPLENNRSERSLRTIAMGRKAWLFCGSDDHAESAANLFTIIASARLHQLDPELYLTELFRVLAQWPRDRYLELSPKYWARTRARLDPQELAREYGRITIPSPLDLQAPGSAD